MAHSRAPACIGFLCLIALHLATASSQAAVIGKLYWSSNSTDTISRCNLDGAQVETVISSLVNPNGPAFALSQQKMYWTEQSLQVMHRANLDGTGTETIMTGNFGTTCGLAVDEPRNRLFWTSDGGYIYRANLDGTGNTQIWNTRNRVLNIAYDPAGDKIYWAESYSPWTGGTPHIRRSNPDGTGAEDLVLSGLNNPFSLALDIIARKIYWGDRNLRTIFRANLDGTEIQTVARGISDPTAIAIDSTSGLLYYANGVGIMRANLDGSNPITVLPNQHYVFGLSVIPLPEPSNLLLLALGAIVVPRRR
jgi:DNA-binding beta-propeller fold protein YncE